jgi:hypothetical protein
MDRGIEARSCFGLRSSTLRDRRRTAWRRSFRKACHSKSVCTLHQLALFLLLSSFSLSCLPCRLTEVYKATPVAICTGRAANAQDARLRAQTRGFPLLSFDCAARQLSLVIREIFAQEPEVKSLFAGCCEIIKWVMAHRQPRDHLREQTRIRLGREVELVRPCATKWSSYIDSMCRLLQCKMPLMGMVLYHREEYLQMASASSSKTEDVLSKLTPEFFTKLKAVLQLLVPLRVAMMRLDSDGAHPGTVWEVYATLFKHLKQAKQGPGGARATFIYDKLRARWVARVGWMPGGSLYL